MAKKNMLLANPPYEVEKLIGKLGTNLRTARLRRGLTIKDVADKIGTGVRSISDAESGKPSASIVTYYALLWVYGLLEQIEDIAEPTQDIVGLTLASQKDPKRAKSAKGITNDF